MSAAIREALERTLHYATKLSYSSDEDYAGDLRRARAAIEAVPSEGAVKVRALIERARAATNDAVFSDEDPQAVVDWAEEAALLLGDFVACLAPTLSGEAEAVPVGVLCTGCGSSWNDERLAAEKQKNPALLSCCPERKLIPVYARPVEEPGEVERLTRELAEAKDEVDRLTDENCHLRGEPWQNWATAVLKVIRERSGYDGYDDTSEGVDLPAELDECMGELESAEAHQRTRAETAEAALAETRERLEKREEALREIATWPIAESGVNYRALARKLTDIARAALTGGAQEGGK